MHRSDIAFSHIVVDENIDALYATYMELLSEDRVVGFIREDFLIEDAKAAIAEAYIAEERQKFIILGAKSFNTVSQNALLKILEEPPKNAIFIIMVPSKSTLLSTIRSRLIVKKGVSKRVQNGVDLQLKNLELQALFAFVKEHEKLSRHEAKALLESLFYQAVHVEHLMVSERVCRAFERGIKLVELNSKFSTVLLNILLHFVPKREHAR